MWSEKKDTRTPKKPSNLPKKKVIYLYNREIGCDWMVDFSFILRFYFIDKYVWKMQNKMGISCQPNKMRGTRDGSKRINAFSKVQQNCTETKVMLMKLSDSAWRKANEMFRLVLIFVSLCQMVLVVYSKIPGRSLEAIVAIAWWTCTTVVVTSSTFCKSWTERAAVAACLQNWMNFNCYFCSSFSSRSNSAR